MEVIRVLQPGLASTIQDDGRRAGLESGVPPGGAADRYAYRINCLVLGNAATSAVVEQTLKGGRYQAIEGMTIALTGADMSAAVNGPERLFSTWVTPMTWAARLRKGAQRMLRV